MKKVLTISLAFILVFAFSASALADSISNDCPNVDQRKIQMMGPVGAAGERSGACGSFKGDKQGTCGVNDEQREQCSKEDREQCREKMLADLPDAVANQLEEGRDDIRSQMEENRDLRYSIRDIMRALRANDGELTDEINNDLQAYYDQIRDIHESMRDSRGAIKDILNDLDNISEADAVAAIEELQELKIEMMEDMQSILEDIHSYVESL